MKAGVVGTRESLRSKRSSDPWAAGFLFLCNFLGVDLDFLLRVFLESAGGEGCHRGGPSLSEKAECEYD